MTKKEKDLKANEKEKISLVEVKASFDGALTTRHNKKRWSYASTKSADLDANSKTRQTLRIRARYESNNNSYARGICRTVAFDTFGVGPQLQILGDDKLSKKLERDWQEWCKAVGLIDILRTARYSKMIDGEAFLLITDNKKINNDIKLNIKLIDADRVTDSSIGKSSLVDGVDYDEDGNPTFYTILDNHPTEIRGKKIKSKRVQAKYVIHLYDVLRAGQSRGISELAPCIELFGQLRDYTHTVLVAAKTAAALTGAITTNTPAGGESEAVEPMEVIELEAGQLITLPAGWGLTMTKAEQPTANYKDFKAEILNEIARALQVPYNIAAGNSNDASYASSRMDWQIYYKNIKIEQNYFAVNCLDRIFNNWRKEWELVNGQKVSDINHSWIFDSINEHSDPYKQAHAEEVELRNNTTTLSTIYASKGKNWETELEQIAKEREKLEELGLSSWEGHNNYNEDIDSNLPRGKPRGF